MENSYQKKAKLEAIKLIQENEKDSWQWFLEALDINKASFGETNYKLYYSKWKKKGYFKEILGSPRKIPCKMKKEFKIEVTKIEYRKDAPGPLSRDGRLKKKILNLLSKNINDKDILSRKLKIKRNKITRLINELVTAHLLLEKPILKQSYREENKKYYQFNLTPFFEFCYAVNKNIPEEEKIEFNNEEKRILELLFGEESDYIRGKIYLENKKTNFLNAILKFYVRHFYLPYVESTKAIDTNLSISKEAIKWILNSSSEDFNKEIDILYYENQTPKMKKICGDINKLRTWTTNTATERKLKNKTNTDEDDFNYYGGIYKSFYDYNPTLMSDIGWKLIKVLALTDS